MLDKLKLMVLDGQISKNELLTVLREDAMKINIQDFIQCNLMIRQDAECIHTSYKNDLIESYTTFMIRIQNVKADNYNYNGHVKIDELNIALDLLINQEETIDNFEFGQSFWNIYKNLSLYTTFIIEEPIHQVGMMFPGGFRVKKVGNKFTCPVKENNKDNPHAVCPFCIAEQDDDI